jgi:HD-GYP domain-containing protein (c-di-GMP phosphodiesterase class II)
MTSERAYRLPLPHGEVVRPLRGGVSRQFDPRVVDALLHLI